MEIDETGWNTLIKTVVASIDVSDLDKGIVFYSNGLGFVEQRRLFNDTTAEMLAGQHRVYLLAKPAGTAQ